MTKLKLANGLKAIISPGFEEYGEVDTLKIQVIVKATGQVLLDQKMHNATNHASVSTVSKNGKHLAVISGSFDDVETASIRSGNSAQGISLHDFRGRRLGALALLDTIDHRKAAFSSSGNILAICEDTNVVGFWRTSDGELIGRVVFQTAARGCVVDGATGLSPEFVMANSDGKDGWIVEPSS